MLDIILFSGDVFLDDRGKPRTKRMRRWLLFGIAMIMVGLYFPAGSDINVFFILLGLFAVILVSITFIAFAIGGRFKKEEPEKTKSKKPKKHK